MRRRRRILVSALVVATALLGWDLGAPPGDQWTAGLLVGAVRAYQRTASPYLRKDDGGRRGARFLRLRGLSQGDSLCRGHLPKGL